MSRGDDLAPGKSTLSSGAAGQCPDMRLTGQPLPGEPGNSQTGQEGETSKTLRTQRFDTPQCSLEYLNYSRVHFLHTGVSR
jgi:hypothetical protein